MSGNHIYPTPLIIISSTSINFQSGKNYSSESQEIGLWSHGLTNQSYQVFYGKLYPFVIEVPVREQYVNKILTNYQYRMDARRYQDEVNYQILRTTGLIRHGFIMIPTTAVSFG